jgi:hypothetical protein
LLLSNTIGQARFEHLNQNGGKITVLIQPPAFDQSGWL